MFQRPPLMPSSLDKANDPGPAATDYQPSLARTSSSSSSSSSVGQGNSDRKGQNKSSKSTMSKFGSSVTVLRNIVPLHSQSSLLDMTHEEDDVSIDMEHYHTTHTHTQSSNLTVAAGGPSCAKDRSVENANDTAVTAESSMMEKSMNISESLTSSFSFCCNTSASIPHDNDDTIQDENKQQSQQNQQQSQSSLLSDTLLQKRVLEDFHFLLGSNVMPCCVEKSLFWGDDSMMMSPCGLPFGRGYCHDGAVDEDEYNAMQRAMFEDEFKIRNRAGESWRARAYRLKRLREERSRTSAYIHMPDLNYNNNTVSCRNLHQSSLHSSHPMEGFAEENVHVGARAHGFGATIHSSNPALTKSTSFGQAHALRIQPSVSWYDLTYGSQGVGGNMRSSLYGYQRGPGAPKKPKQEVNVEPLGCMIGDCIEPISPMGDGDDTVELELRDNHRQEYLDEEDLCYDSDPGMPYTQLEMDFMNMNVNVKDTETCCHSDAGNSATSTYASAGLDKAALHGRSKSETSITHKSPTSPGSPTPSPFSPKKKWFRSPRRRRRKMHFDSFDDSLDSEQKSESASISGSTATRGQNNTTIGKSDSFDGANNARANFYGNGNANSGSNLTDPSFDEFDDKFKVDYGRKTLGIMDSDRDIVDHVQDSLNNTWTLTWHPPISDRSEKAKSLFKNQSNSISTSTTGTRCIQVWFERGNRIRRNDILEPKLMWRDAYHPDLASTRTLNRSTTQGPYKICLLSICRILEAHKIDRTKYPFAKKSCSFIIKTSDDEEFVFEASTPKQRDFIVNTWKLVVARLASQAVVGDGEGMVGEFFVSSAFGVP